MKNPLAENDDQYICPLLPALSGVDPPAWYSPLRVLGLLSAVSFFIYIDRGVIASNGVQGDNKRGMQHDLNLDLFQLGILPGAFMVGLLVASLVFGELAKYTSAFRIIGYGTLLWVVASVGCGLATEFWFILACRIVMGIGEASIINLAMPFIDDVAPPLSKTLWFSLFYVSSTVGSSLGYIFGGLLGLASWRYPFFVQAFAALPLTLFFLLAPPLHLPSLQEEPHAGHMEPLLPGQCRAQKHGFASDIYCLLWKHPMYLLNSLAYCPIQGVFGSYGYWGPKAVHEMLGTKEEVVDLSFSIIGTMAGVMGTLLGGAWLDAVGSDIQYANTFCTVCAALSGVAAVLSFAGAKTLPAFICFFTIASLGCNAISGPGTAVVVWGVPRRLRPLASGLGTMAYHLFGDVPAPPLVGWMQGRIQDWRWTMGMLGGFSMLGAVLYGACLLTPVQDYRPHEEILLCRSQSRIGGASFEVPRPE